MSLDRQWEKFRGGPTASSAERIRVTLNREGLIYMNAKAYAAFGRPKAVAIYYNRETDAIALEPAHHRFEENFQVINRQNGWVIHASPFIVHHRIRIDGTERFIRPEITQEGQMTLNLRETVSVTRINRGARMRVRKRESATSAANIEPS